MYLELRSSPHIHLIQLIWIAILSIIQMDKLAYKIRRMCQVPLTADVATQYGIQVTLTFVSGIIGCPAMLFVDVWEKFKTTQSDTWDYTIR